VHFAQVNEMDGFFLAARDADTDFTWSKLEGADVLVHHAGQPMAMFKYACHNAGIDFAKINVIDAGNGGQMDEAFRGGQGQYIHQQGPAPQQLQADGLGHLVAQVGPVVGTCGFSSLACTREWLQTDIAKAFTRAYIKTRNYMNDTPAVEIARAEAEHFANIDEAVLSDCIATYQQLGCWTRHVNITRPAYQKILDIYEFNGALKARYAYEQVCAESPSV
jgi:NitT/TauT family transport system substrate-binding protein